MTRVRRFFLSDAVALGLMAGSVAIWGLAENAFAGTPVRPYYEFIRNPVLFWIGLFAVYLLVVDRFTLRMQQRVFRNGGGSEPQYIVMMNRISEMGWTHRASGRYIRNSTLLGLAAISLWATLAASARIDGMLPTWLVLDFAHAIFFMILAVVFVAHVWESTNLDRWVRTTIPALVLELEDLLPTVNVTSRAVVTEVGKFEFHGFGGSTRIRFTPQWNEAQKLHSFVHYFRPPELTVDDDWYDTYPVIPGLMDRVAAVGGQALP